MSKAFSRLTNRVLALLGEDSILRGEIVTPPRKIHIKHGVQFSGYNGESTAMSKGDLVVDKSVATIPKEYLPRVGDRLQHPDGDYDLDVLHADNGYSIQFILRKHYE